MSIPARPNRQALLLLANVQHPLPASFFLLFYLPSITMNQHTRLCALESLNTDVLIAILSTCDSFSDLASFIRASPTLLHAFLSAKAAILLHVVSNILGPATRDAALLAQTSQFVCMGREDDEDLECKVDAAVQDYRARLCVVSAPWVRTLDADTAVAMTHVTRLAQFYVDAFSYFRFRYFAHKLDPTQANTPPPPPQPRLSRTEHGRIAEAVLRRQLLVHFHGFSEPRDYPRFARAVFSLFHPWELQQISDIDHFLGQLLGSLAEYQMRVPGPNGQRIPVRWQRWEWDYSPDLERFAIKLKSLLDVDFYLDRSLHLDSSLLDPLCQWSVFSGRVSAGSALYKMFVGSHYLTTPSSSHSNQQLASDIAAADFGQETSSQPWAWKDALRGHETCRWGRDLVKAPPRDSANQQDYEQAKSALESWRWFGMVFWDRERAEQLKQSSALKSCKSGWLVPWQD